MTKYPITKENSKTGDMHYFLMNTGEGANVIFEVKEIYLPFED
jgi:hypothetical protein